jgi:hypothetical protein
MRNQSIWFDVTQMRSIMNRLTCPEIIFQNDFMLKTFRTGSRPEQGCQMVCFETKNQNLGKFQRVLHRRMLIYFMHTWFILRSFVIFMDIWYSSWWFGIFFPFWYFVSRKIWQPSLRRIRIFRYCFQPNQKRAERARLSKNWKGTSALTYRIILF